jgi:hypothetical protein
MRVSPLVYTSFVGTIPLNADEATIERAREVARTENKTLEEAFADWLVCYASRKATRAKIEALYERLQHVDAGRKFPRDEMNER